MVKGIAFDMDGTLLDSQETLIKGEIAAFASKGLIVTPSELRKFGGVSVKDLAKAFLKDPTEKDILEFRRIRKEIVLQNLNDITVFPDTKSALQKLRQRGIKLAIATGLGSDLLGSFLEKTGVSAFLDAWVSADQVRAGKPAPDVFLRAFELMKIKPEEGLVVGDSKMDILGGRAAKVPSVLISREGIQACDADYTIKNLEELLNLV